MNTFKGDTFFCMRSVFVLVFFYALSVGLIIQWVILPFVSPELNDGYGLLKGSDWTWFQEQAVQLAARIRQEGWHLWELRPKGNAPIGIAAAIYAVTGYNEPWILLPLNATLFAIGATCLYAIVALISQRHIAFIAIAPFVLFPSAVMIYAQIHKDVWSIAGVALNVLVWVRFATFPTMSAKNAGVQCVLAFAGAVLVWVVRPYLVQVLLTTSILTLCFLLCRTFIARGRENYSLWWWIGGGVSVLLLVFMGKLGTAFPEEAEVQTGKTVILDRERMVHSQTDASGRLEEKPATSIAAVVQTTMDSLLLKFINTRQGFSRGYPKAGSNIDTEKSFHSITDVIKYIPRALQIGLLAPFPIHWTETGVSPGANYMRRFAALEMGLTYLLLPGIAFLLIRGNARGAIVVILIQSIVPLIILALIVTNVGTLYRMRYFDLQVLNGLGLIGWMMWYQHLNSRHRGISV